MKHTFRLLLSIITVFILTIGLMGLIYSANEGGEENLLPSNTHSTIELNKSNINTPDLSEPDDSDNDNDNEESSNSENEQDETDRNSSSNDNTNDNSSNMSSENEKNQQDENDTSDSEGSTQSPNDNDNNQSQESSESNQTTTSNSSNDNSDSDQSDEKKPSSNESDNEEDNNGSNKKQNDAKENKESDKEPDNKEESQEEESKEKENKKTVTVSIVADKEMGTILEPTSVEIGEDDTVLSALINVTQAKEIPMSFRGGHGANAYIEGINSLFEFDRGSGSGWMFKINNIFPNRGAGVIPLRDGDRIEWLYTLDLGEDLGADLKPFRE